MAVQSREGVPDEGQNVEKQTGQFAQDGRSTSSENQPEATWDLAAEGKARRKIDRSVLFLLFLGLLVFQLDRMNLASALTAGFAADINIDQDTINLGNQLMFMGIVIFEIPCNMALQKIGPRKWMAGQVLAFGFIATMQVFIKNRGGFLALRLMLGFSEAGYIPGGVYTLSTWYTKRELSRRVSVFFFGMFGGNAISPILASGILKLEGAHGIKGWQWLFMLEGIFTIVVAFILLLFLPGSPDIPRPLVGPGLVRFSSSERDILQRRLEIDDPEGKRSGVQGLAIDWALVRRTVLHYRRWPHYIAAFAVFSTWSPLTTYTPSIIVSLGFDRITANALAAVGASLALPIVFFFGYLSDRTNLRGGTVIAGHVCYLITLIIARQLHPHVGYHPVSNSWVQLNCREAGERSIAIAMWVMSAISGLMVGTQYFRPNDTPFYQTGLRTMIIMVTVGIVFASLQIIIYVVHNKRVSQGKYGSRGGSPPMIYTP
ncbi:hypothetical protein FSHL1_006477 [Fusarium sambucinum]